MQKLGFWILASAMTMGISEFNVLDAGFCFLIGKIGKINLRDLYLFITMYRNERSFVNSCFFLPFQEKCLTAIEESMSTKETPDPVIDSEAPPIHIRQLLLLLQKHLFAYCQNPVTTDMPTYLPSAVKLLQSHLLLYLPCVGEILSSAHSVLVRDGVSQVRDKIHSK